MERHFSCTACGKCCVGLVPLTLYESLRYADRFPLAMVWTAVPQGAKSFSLTSRLGTVVQLARRRQVAVQVGPMAYLPPSFPCPELTDTGLCGIHAEKPIRCRTMPFYPYREEDDQGEFLIPRAGWVCDISKEAPVVYRDKRILVREDFDEERRRLLAQAPMLKAYADRVVASAPNVVRELEMLSQRPNGGRLALSFTGILPRLPNVDIAEFAQAQLPVLRKYAELTAADGTVREFHEHYRNAIRALEAVVGSIGSG